MAEAAAAVAVAPDAVDTGIATTLLVFGAGFLMLSSFAMVLFYRERNAFEIRARSASLSLLNGLCYMALLVVLVAGHLPDIVEKADFNICAMFTLYFFLAACNTCCLGSKTIRLALLYYPKARKAAPWLVPERNHVIACLLLGAATTVWPLYDCDQAGHGPSAELELLAAVRDHLWIVRYTTLAIMLLLNPLAWLIDDIFGVGPELRARTAVQVITTLTGRLVEEYAPPNLVRWIDSRKMGILACVFMISISIISPIRRRLLHPLESSDPKVAKALERRRALGTDKRASTRPSAVGGRASSSASSTSSKKQPFSAGRDAASWTFERVMMMPETAAAFEQFSRKALCQESFLFLKDAAGFQAQSFGDGEAESAGDSKDSKGGSADAEEKSEGRRQSSTCVGGSRTNFALFSKIVREYIVDGAPSEINISWQDKKSILDVYNKSGEELGFNELPVRQRRLVFARAYAEIRHMLESNLMRRFVSSDEFENALAAGLRTEGQLC